MDVKVIDVRNLDIIDIDILDNISIKEDSL